MRYGYLRLPHYCAVFFRCLAVAALCFVGAAQAEQAAQTTQSGPLVMEVFDKALPSSAIITADGGSVRLADFAGKPLLVNFWAMWCAPCIHELPALDRAADIVGDEIQILLVSIDRGGADKAAEFLAQHNITRIPAAYDTASDWTRALEIRGLPATLILSADQQHVWLVTGPEEWDSKTVLDQLRATLAGATLATQK